MAKFTRSSEFERWLKSRSKEEAVVLASRIAMRVTPMLAQELSTRKRDNARAALFLPVFRAASISWSAGNSLTHDTVNAAAANAVGAADAARAATAVGGANAARAAAANAAAAAAAHAAAAHVHPVLYATAANAAVNAAANANAIWDSISQDATALGRGWLHPRSGWTPAQLALAPLWPQGDAPKPGAIWPQGETPDWAAKDWATLKAHLLSPEAGDEDWGVWTDWYEARLKGGPINLELERARALISGDIWKQGPSVVNAEIRRLEKAHKPKPGRAEVGDAASPLPVYDAAAQAVSTRPNPEYDKPVGSEELLSLPGRQQEVIDDLLYVIEGAGGNAAFGFTAERGLACRSLTRYGAELNGGAELSPATLKLGYERVVAFHASLVSNGEVQDGDTVDVTFAQFISMHQTLILHYPLDAKRDLLYAARELDRGALDPKLCERLSRDVEALVKRARAAGVVSESLEDAAQEIMEALRIASLPPLVADEKDRLVPWRNREVQRAFGFLDKTNTNLRRETFHDAAAAASLSSGIEPLLAHLLRVIFG